MTLTQLRYFRQACQEKSLSQAAETLHISQPSVSVAIRELEQEFGFRLINRCGRTFSLTREGQAFLEQADSLLSHADSFQNNMQGLAGEGEEIRLGVPPMVGSLLLPPLYAAMEESSRRFHITIVESGRQPLLDQLDHYKLDMAFLPHTMPWTSYGSLPVMQIDTVCCTSLIHPAGKKRSVSMKDLKDEPLVLFNQDFFQTERVLERFRQEGAEPHILLQTEQLSTIRKMIARNLAISFLFRDLAEPMHDIVSVPLDPPMPVGISLVWRSDVPPTAVRKSFLDFVSSLFLP